MRSAVLHDESILGSLTCVGRKRKRTVSALFLLSLAACAWQGSAFGLPKWSRRRLSFSRKTRDANQARFADQNDDGVDSWSKSASGRKSSPLQVRKRVRAVLEKARTRTGIDNSSGNAKNIVAEAASIGGLVDDNVLIEIQQSANNIQNGANVEQTSWNGKTSTPAAFPDEALIVQTTNGTSLESPPGRKPKDFDVIRGDMPAANTFCEPLPFELPKLSPEQIQRLQAGERIQEQARMGREGSGFVALDVKAPPYVVWECLLDFESYPELIPTVREMQLYTSEKLKFGFVNEKPVFPGTGRETRHYGTPSITRAAFVLSKFRLNIAAIHRYTPHPDGDYMVFTLDKSCTNMVLKGAKGIWHTVADPDGREGYTRVFLLCEVQISRALPSFIVDYAAVRAMPRASTWLKPQVEAAAELWLKAPGP